MKHINKLPFEDRRDLPHKIQNYIVDLEMELDNRRDRTLTLKAALTILCAEMGDTKVSLKLAEHIFNALND